MISTRNGVPARARTGGVLLRRQALYPTEVQRLIHLLNDYAQNIQNSDLNGITLRRGLLYPFNYGGREDKIRHADSRRVMWLS